MKLTVLVIPADGAPEVREIEDYDYRAGQAIVGGLIQPVDCDEVGATIWANEEGLLLRLPINRHATAFLCSVAPEHVGFTMLVGDCYVSGLPDEEGDTTSVPDQVLRYFGL